MLTATSPPAHRAGRRQFAAALSAHAETLLDVQVECRHLRSLDADDPRPAFQMREIRAAMRHLAATPDRASNPADQAALLAALRPALSFAPSVAAITRAQVAGGHWLQPAARSELGWERASDNARITYAVELAAAEAQELTERLPPRRPIPSPFQSPHDLLDQQQLHRDRRRGPSPAGTHPVVYGASVVSLLVALSTPPGGSLAPSSIQKPPFCLRYHPSPCCRAPSPIPPKARIVEPSFIALDLDKQIYQSA